MFCAISGEPPAQPVVSIKSGQLYEARLIRKYIDENGKDPITGDSLSHDDIVEVKANPRTAAPRPPSHSSIPSLLTSLQNEYDALMMELFTLKRNYDDVRQELAHALYANDAANRVVARLMGERDEARKALANISTSLGVAAPAVGEDAEMADAAEPAAAAGGLPPAAADIITSTAETLSSQRRAKMKRKAPQGYASATDVQSFTQITSLPSMHGTRPAGVSALNLSHSGNLLITGGNDKQVQVYDRAADKTLATLKGHTKRITRVVFTPPAAGTPDVGVDAAVVGAPPYAISASEDHSLRIWKLEDGASATPSYALAHTLKAYKAEVTGLDVHPSGLLVGSASRDGTWALHDVASGERLLAVDAPSNEAEEEAAGGYAYESFAFHPDGQLAATGTAEGAIRVWDVKAVQKVSTFAGHAGKGVCALSFSENGYYLAAGARGSGEVKVWDLRKLSVAGTIVAGDEGASVSAVAFDPTAQLLAVVGTDVRVYANKTWTQLLVDDANTAECTACAWDRRDGSLVVSSLDRTVRTLGTAPAAA